MLLDLNVSGEVRTQHSVREKEVDDGDDDDDDDDGDYCDYYEYDDYGLMIMV